MRRRVALVALVASALSAAAYAQLRDKTPPAGGGLYRVTHLPDHTGPDESYVKEVEEHLNKMAADGWRFHSDFVAQNVKMMLFERASGR
ncbi:MAG: hypothetical protein V1790_00285 [Planctomycetota bacterium]